jgi:hypothetical protein
MQGMIPDTIIYYILYYNIKRGYPISLKNFKIDILLDSFSFLKHSNVFDEEEIH